MDEIDLILILFKNGKMQAQSFSAASNADIIIERMNDFILAVAPDDSGNLLMDTIEPSFKDLNFQINQKELNLDADDSIYQMMTDLEKKTITKYKDLKETELFSFQKIYGENRFSFLKGSKNYQYSNYELKTDFKETTGNLVSIHQKTRDTSFFKTPELILNSMMPYIECELSAKIIFGKKYQVLMTEKALSTFFRFIISTLYQRKNDLFAKKQVRFFSEKLTLWDDSTLTKGWFTRPYDFLGMNSKKQELVKQGFINESIIDIHDFLKTKIAPSPNGYYTDGALIYRPTNGVIEKGKLSEFDLIKDLKQGIRLVSIEDIFLHEDELIIRGKGDYYANGEKLHSVKNLIIKDKMNTVFNSIIEITGKEIICEGFEGASVLFDSLYCHSYT